MFVCFCSKFEYFFGSKYVFRISIFKFMFAFKLFCRLNFPLKLSAKIPLALLKSKLGEMISKKSGPATIVEFELKSYMRRTKRPANTWNMFVPFLSLNIVLYIIIHIKNPFE